MKSRSRGLPVMLPSLMVRMKFGLVAFLYDPYKGGYKGGKSTLLVGHTFPETNSKWAPSSYAGES